MADLVKSTYTQEIDNFRDLCKTAMASGKYGPEMNEATMLNIMMTARDYGISPMKAINGGFYIVNGKISMATTLMIDRIRSQGHSISVLDWTKEKCIVLGKRKDTGDTCKVEYTLEDAQLAGLLNSPTWKKHPKSMLSARAHSMLARVLFPDVVGNAYSEDEAHEIAGVPASKRPDVDPENIEVTLDVKPECDYVALHEKAGVGTIDDVKEFVKSIAINKKWSDEEVVESVIKNEKALATFKEQLTKRIERKYLEQSQSVATSE